MIRQFCKQELALSLRYVAELRNETKEAAVYTGLLVTKLQLW